MTKKRYGKDMEMEKDPKKIQTRQVATDGSELLSECPGSLVAGSRLGQE
jgi:hypothetical protein